MRTSKTFLVVSAGFFCLALLQAAGAATITPEALKFESRLDEPVLLSLDVDLERDSSSQVDITVDGFHCDRRVHNLGGGKHRIEIAPETLMAGPVRGKIQVQVNDEALGDPVPIPAFVVLSRLALRSVAAWIFLTVLVAGTLLIAGYVALRSRPLVTPLDMAGFSGLEVKPRSGTHKGTVFYFGDRAETPRDLLKSTLRPLAQKGWSVVCFEQPQFTSDARTAMSEIVEEFCTTRLQGKTWSLAGHRRGALFALEIGASVTPSAISCYMTPNLSPLSEISPLSLVQKLTCPLLLCAQQADPGRSALWLKKAAPLASTRSLQQQTHLGEFSDESKHWQLWIEETGKLLADIDAENPVE